MIIDKKAQDMSVEEILKSIKTIIDCHNNTVSPTIEPQNAEEDILELTEIVSNSEEKNDSTIAEIDAKNLLSEKVAKEAENSFKNFIQSVKVSHTEDNKKLTNLTIEELVVEMMRPQLSKWLNDNLPAIVKQLVEQELKKLIPKEKE